MNTLNSRFYIAALVLPLLFGWYVFIFMASTTALVMSSSGTAGAGGSGRMFRGLSGENVSSAANAIVVTGGRNGAASVGANPLDILDEDNLFASKSAITNDFVFSEVSSRSRAPHSAGTPKSVDVSCAPANKNDKNTADADNENTKHAVSQVLQDVINTVFDKLKRRSSSSTLPPRRKPQRSVFRSVVAGLSSADVRLQAARSRSCSPFTVDGSSIVRSATLSSSEPKRSQSPSFFTSVISAASVQKVNATSAHRSRSSSVSSDMSVKQARHNRASTPSSQVASSSIDAQLATPLSSIQQREPTSLATSSSGRKRKRSSASSDRSSKTIKVMLDPKDSAARAAVTKCGYHHKVTMPVRSNRKLCRLFKHLLSKKWEKLFNGKIAREKLRLFVAIDGAPVGAGWTEKTAKANGKTFEQLLSGRDTFLHTPSGDDALRLIYTFGASVTKSSTSSSSSSRALRCGKCAGCAAPDCGQCLFCKDKKKFGGSGKLHRACSKRVCENMARSSPGPHSRRSLAKSPSSKGSKGKSARLGKGSSKASSSKSKGGKKSSKASKPRSKAAAKGGKKSSLDLRREAVLASTASAAASASTMTKGLNNEELPVFDEGDDELVAVAHLSEELKFDLNDSRLSFEAPRTRDGNSRFGDLRWDILDNNNSLFPANSNSMFKFK